MAGLSRSQLIIDQAANKSTRDLLSSIYQVLMGLALCQSAKKHLLKCSSNNNNNNKK